MIIAVINSRRKWLQKIHTCGAQRASPNDILSRGNSVIVLFPPLEGHCL